MSYSKLLATLLVLAPITTTSAQTVANTSLAGTWKLTAANKILPDGTEVADYGAAPEGMAVFNADGSYMLEIYRAERLKFANNDRAHGTPEEYKDAALSTSCHFGHYSVDVAKGKIIFNIERATYPNWDRTSRASDFKLVGDTLSWRVPARPDGSVPVTYLQRVHQ
ncbi:MAG TPA: lipocalin-like domain-containing protein [Terriglobus sp.]